MQRNRYSWRWQSPKAALTVTCFVRHKMRPQWAVVAYWPNNNYACLASHGHCKSSSYCKLSFTKLLSLLGFKCLIISADFFIPNPAAIKTQMNFFCSVMIIPSLKNYNGWFLCNWWYIYVFVRECIFTMSCAKPLSVRILTSMAFNHDEQTQFIKNCHTRKRS